VPLLHLDFETFGFADLKKAGTHRYLSDGRTELQLQQWAVDDGPVRVEEADPQTVLHPELEALVRDSRYYIVAFNATFERFALGYLCDIWLPPERFICTMALAYHFSYAGSLAQICDQLNLPEHLRKLGRDGSRIMLKFAKPRRPTRADPSLRWTKHNASTDWATYLRYGEFDVLASRAIWDHFATHNAEYLAGYWWTTERPLWCVDQRINERGWPLDTQLIERACTLYDALKQRMRADLDKFTGLVNSNSREQMLSWLRVRGCMLDDLREATRADALKSPTLAPDVRHALVQYGYLQKATPDKFLALLRAQHGGRIKGTLQHGGASRSNRWAGRIFQPQNLYSARSWKPHELDQLCENLRSLDADTLHLLYPDMMEALSAAIRPAVMAPDGKMLVVVDLSAIESRILGWLSDCLRIVRLFARGLDTYKDLAAQYFRVHLADVTKRQRTFAKPAVLGCGYRLGGPGLVRYADGMGVAMSEDAAQRMVDIWRSGHPEVVQMWRDYEAAAEAVTLGRVERKTTHRVTFTRDRTHLMAELPSGRRIHYRSPTVKPGKYRTGLHYHGRDDKGSAFWGEREMHGGPWTENIDQAIARDVLAEALIKVEALPYAELVGHVHDEVVVVVDEAQADVALSAITEILSTSPDWAPDLLLDAEGHIMKRYKKL